MVPATYIAEYKVQLAKGDLKRIEGFVQLAASTRRQRDVAIPDAGIRTTVRTDAGGYAALSIPVDSISYWTPERPKLYTSSWRPPATGSATGSVPHHRDARPGYPAQRQIDLLARHLGA